MLTFENSSDKIKYVRESEWKTNKTINTFSNMNSRHVVLMNKIKKFYSHKNNLEILISIIEGTSYLSLRVIDFFVTNYAREKEIIYEKNKKDIECEKDIENFMVYYSYKSQLKAYSKKQFDPFCRRERILFFIDKYDGVNNSPIRTTVGQLNFFRWAIKNNILEYIHKHYESIENEMNKFSKKKVKTVNEENKVTVNDLTLSATKKVNKHNITITVKFN